MLKLLKVVKVILIFIVVNIIGAITLNYVEPIIFQESDLDPMVQILIFLGLFFVFLLGLIHTYIKNKTKQEKS